MNPYDHGPFEEHADDELAAALDVLKGLSQSNAAFEIGVSERRFRDIERGRAQPRRKTREAILRLADDLRAGWRPDADEPFVTAKSASSGNESDSGFPVGTLVVVLFFVGLIAFAMVISRPPEQK